MDDLDVALLVVLNGEESEEEIHRRSESHLFKKRTTEGAYKILICLHLYSNENKFREYFRLTPALFDYVLGYIEEDLCSKLTNRVQNPLTPEQKLFLLLRYGFPLILTTSNTKMYSLIEFKDDEGLSIVNSGWLTPRKREVFWPPVKDQSAFNKVVRKSEVDSETWKLYSINKVYYECELFFEELLSKNFHSKKFCRRIFRTPPYFLDDLEVASSSSYSDRSSVTLIADGGSYDSENSVSNEKLLSILLQVREQNKQILAHLNKNQNVQVTPLDNVSQNFPFQLPLLTLENLEHLETYLGNKDNAATLVMYLSRIGGRNLVTLVNNIMRKCLTNELASLFNFFGKRLNKNAFAELHIKSVVIAAVQRVYAGSTEKEVESSIKIWLKHAPQRLSAERKNIKDIKVVGERQIYRRVAFYKKQLVSEGNKPRQFINSGVCSTSAAVALLNILIAVNVVLILGNYYIRKRGKSGTGSAGEAAKKRSELLSFLDSCPSAKRSTLSNIPHDDDDEASQRLNEDISQIDSQNISETSDAVELTSPREEEEAVSLSWDVHSPEYSSQITTTPNTTSTTSATSSTSTHMATVRSASKRKSSSTSEARLHLLQDIARRTQRAAETQDETDLYFASMAKIVKKLPLQEQIRLRLQIGTLIGNAELTFYNQTNTSTRNTYYVPSPELSTSTSTEESSDYYHFTPL
ncbi:hypothetical protein FQR65_LT15986 [Abscondita terminalis]|nr:hypothetical protein FQR65_LT15986 [Abscondita terminalis]